MGNKLHGPTRDTLGGMPDPLKELSNQRAREQLTWLRVNYGEVIESARLASLLLGFRSQKGIYKPAGSPHALWVRETLRSPYSDQVSHHVDRPDGSWLYKYSPEGRQGKTDLGLDTNRALLKCREDGVPVGVLRQTSAGRGSSAYEVADHNAKHEEISLLHHELADGGFDV